MQFDPSTQSAVVWAAVATAFFTAIVALVAVINSWNRINEVASRGRSTIVASWRRARRLVGGASRGLRGKLWEYANPHAEATRRTGGLAEEWARRAAASGDAVLREPWKHLGSGCYVGGSALHVQGSHTTDPGLTFWWTDGSRCTVFWRAGNYLLEVNQPTSESAWDWKPASGADHQWWAGSTLAKWVEQVDLDQSGPEY